ncbi:MAG: hypothetical protein L0Z49_06720, partial [Actinobacteria bacterium]|nr:hypothetical protein [Actinomycetota bacterium]
FWIQLAPEQRALVPLDAPVDVSYGGGVWQAATVQTIEFEDPQGFTELRLILESEDGGSVCGSECADWVPLESRTDFPAQVIVVPETTGPVVPVAAISTEPDGSTFLTRGSGETADVEVVASANGLAVVDGVQVGDVVLLPSDPDDGG